MIRLALNGGINFLHTIGQYVVTGGSDGAVRFFDVQVRCVLVVIMRVADHDTVFVRRPFPVFFVHVSRMSFVDWTQVHTSCVDVSAISVFDASIYYDHDGHLDIFFACYV